MVLRAGDGLAARPAALAARIVAAERAAAHGGRVAVGARGRELPGGPRRRQHHHRRLSRGSPTGGATPSSPCAGCALGTGKPARGARASCSPGPGRSAKACCPTASPTRGDAPEYNAVDASLWFVVAVHDYFRAAAEAGARRRPGRSGRAAGRGGGDTARPRERHALRHRCRQRRPAARPASRACSSPGWTRSSATGWSRRASASRWRCRRCGSTRCASAPPGRRGGRRWRGRRAPPSPPASPTPRRAGCSTWSTPTIVARRGGPARAAEPGARRRRPALPGGRGDGGAARLPPATPGCARRTPHRVAPRRWAGALVPRPPGGRRPDC